MNLAQSFRLRNKVKEKISKLQEAIFSAGFTKEAGKDEETYKTNGMPMVDAVETVTKLMRQLMVLNQAIEKANVGNKAALVQLESTKAELAFIEKLAINLRNQRLSRQDYNATGGYDKVQLEPTLEQSKILDHVETLIKRKDAIEAELANSNFSTEVEFDEKTFEGLI